jgi:hypothetical protein
MARERTALLGKKSANLEMGGLSVQLAVLMRRLEILNRILTKSQHLLLQKIPDIYEHGPDLSGDLFKYQEWEKMKTHQTELKQEWNEISKIVEETHREISKIKKRMKVAQVKERLQGKTSGSP